MGRVTPLNKTSDPWKRDAVTVSQTCGSLVRACNIYPDTITFKNEALNPKNSPFEQFHRVGRNSERFSVCLGGPCFRLSVPCFAPLSLCFVFVFSFQCLFFLFVVCFCFLFSSGVWVSYFCFLCFSTFRFLCLHFDFRSILVPLFRVFFCPFFFRFVCVLAFVFSFFVFIFSCGEVGLVIRLYLLFGEVRSVTTALKVVEEEQEGLQEIKENEKKRMLDGMESSKSKSDAHCMHR